MECDATMIWYLMFFLKVMFHSVWYIPFARVKFCSAISPDDVFCSPLLSSSSSSTAVGSEPLQDNELIYNS